MKKKHLRQLNQVLQRKEKVGKKINLSYYIELNIRRYSVPSFLLNKIKDIHKNGNI